MEWLRLVGPLALSLIAVLFVEARMEKRGLVPPRFRGRAQGIPDIDSIARRGLASVGLLLTFWVAIFASLSTLGAGVPVDLDDLEIPQLFALHGLLALMLAGWYGLGFLPHRGEATTWQAQFGLRARSVPFELAIGAAAGFGVWLVAIAVLVVLSALIAAFGGAEALPDEPSGMVLWIVGLPLPVRIMLALSAGVFEEIFFRGFLQPRVGVGLSTALFVLAHTSYEQPFMLIGVGVLSLLFAQLVRLRQSIWAAIAAHAIFDLVQLIFVIPLAQRMLES